MIEALIQTIISQAKEIALLQGQPSGREMELEAFLAAKTEVVDKLLREIHEWKAKTDHLRTENDTLTRAARDAKNVCSSLLKEKGSPSIYDLNAIINSRFSGRPVLTKWATFSNEELLGIRDELSHKVEDCYQLFIEMKQRGIV